MYTIHYSFINYKIALMIITSTAILEDKKALTEHIYLLRFKPVENQFPFAPGQYVILHIPQGQSQSARRLYSIASPASKTETFELIVEIVPGGVASEYLTKMKIGESLTVQGPAGIFTLKENDRDIIFLATGTGIAPMRSMIYHLLEEAPASGKKIALFWGLPSFHSIYLLEEFAALQAKHTNFSFSICLSREASLEDMPNKEHQQYCMLGHINNALEQKITDDNTRYQYYLCGGPKVIESLKEYLSGRNIPKEQVHFEKFTA